MLGATSVRPLRCGDTNSGWVGSLENGHMSIRGSVVPGGGGGVGVPDPGGGGGDWSPPADGGGGGVPPSPPPPPPPPPPPGGGGGVMTGLPFESQSTRGGTGVHVMRPALRALALALAWPE